MSITNAYSLTRDHTSHAPATVSCIEHDAQSNWQQEYKYSITDLADLCQALELKANQLPFSLASQQQFPLRVPKSYLQRIKKSNPKDPLLLQVLPTTYEQKNTLGFTKDPVGDLQSIKSKGLLQKYNCRALLLTTSLCAIHCRYCFRRHFPYTEQNPRRDAWQQALTEIEKDKTIHEIILSGGDPLALDDAVLRNLINSIENIKHLKRLRIHTRLPVVIPNRVCDELLTWISNSRLKIIVVLHINHAQEINKEFRLKVKQLANTQCTLLNQSVLLKNINDDVESLIALSEALFANNILPYYLHLLDKVEGAEHFDVSKQQAKNLMKQVCCHLPGYMVPKLVEEVAGMPAKSLIDY